MTTPSELEGDGLANEKRSVYLQVIPITLVPLKGKGFKYEAGGEEKVGDKPAVILKVTGPDGKDFTLYFDKESGLPVKLVAKVIGFQGQENTGDDLRRLQGLRRDQEGHQDRGQARRQDVDDRRSPSSRSWIRWIPQPSPSRSDAASGRFGEVAGRFSINP